MDERFLGWEHCDIENTTVCHIRYSANIPPVDVVKDELLIGLVGELDGMQENARPNRLPIAMITGINRLVTQTPTHGGSSQLQEHSILEEKQRQLVIKRSVSLGDEGKVVESPSVIDRITQVALRPKPALLDLLDS